MGTFHKGSDALAELPDTTSDSLMFVRRAFPEVYEMSVTHGWKYDYLPKADIYEYGRAGHDLKCMSTRPKPVGEATGAIPAPDPINPRFWVPSKHLLEPIEKDYRPNAPKQKGKKSKRKASQEHGTNFVELPTIGLVEVTDDGVFVLENDDVKLVTSVPGSIASVQHEIHSKPLKDI